MGVVSSFPSNIGNHAPTHAANGSDPIFPHMIGAKVNDNLLDNAYFVGGGSQRGGGQFPINKRGGMIAPATAPYYTDATFSTQVGLLENPVAVVSYAGTYAEIKLDGVSYYCYLPHCIPGYLGAWEYTIDRWKKTNYGSITLTSSGLVVANNETPHQILEKGLSESLYGKTLTFSLLFGDKLVSGSFIMPNNINVDMLIGDTDGVKLFLRGGGDVLYHVALQNNSGREQTYKAAKLELGDKQTLVHQENGVLVLNEVPNYQEQLTRCQRHQVLIPFVIGDALSTTVSDGNGNCAFPIHLPTTPRTTSGTFLLKSGQLRVHGQDTDYSTVTVETTVRVQGNIASLYVFDLTRLKLYSLDSATGGEFLLDFNL